MPGMYKRLVSAFVVFLIMLCVMNVRLLELTSDKTLMEAAELQSSYRIEVGGSRGYIYDCSFIPLVNTESELRAAVMPAPETIGIITAGNTDEGVMKQLSSGKPFVMSAEELPPIENDYIKIFDTVSRYPFMGTIAPQIVGHLNASGDGVYGLEGVLDEVLSGYGGGISVRYTADAYSRALNGYPAEVLDDNYGSKQGVVLTIDKRIQEIAEASAKGMIDRGAVVVMECDTGELKALVSLPEFNQNNLAEASEDPGKPFVNRNFCAYNVGSVFKLCTAAAALEYGYSSEQEYYCPGYITVGGVKFGCHYSSGHGMIGMKRALEISCNPYFIETGAKLGGMSLLQMARGLGFSKPTEFYSGYKTEAGTLPSEDMLKNAGELANFSFGQGALTATPIQIAKMLTAFTNGGRVVEPQLILGFSDESGEKIQTYTPKSDSIRVLSESTANRIKEFMIDVVENGSGSKSKPKLHGAGGKTASAQTGLFTTTPDGREKERVDAWFCGFFPAANPKYVIVILNEDGDSGADNAAPVFKKIADALIER